MKTPPVYDWSVEKYIAFVEKGSGTIIRGYEQAELDYLMTQVKNPQDKTFIDVGAGYGRVLPHIAPPRTRNIIAVEINDSMFSELQKRAKQYPNVKAVRGDANNLSQLLSGLDIQSPVVLSLQNSLGTWEGDYRKALSEMRKIAERKRGEIIISVWRQEGFKKHAIDFYNSISALVGEPDLEKTDSANGLYVSKSGYITYWWSPKQREEMIRIIGGRKVNEILGTSFFTLHASYT